MQKIIRIIVLANQIACVTFTFSIKSSFAEESEFAPIIVTATKRIEDSQHLGLSTQTLLGDELVKEGIYDLRAISNTIPGLDIRSAEGDHNQIITIRGVGLRAANANISPSVGVHNDGVYQATPAYLSFPLFDIERIEVLKGPQGTLYGKNTTGGAINIVTRKPSQQQEAYTHLSYSRFNDVRVESVIGGSLTDNLSGRIAVLANYSEGHQHNQIASMDDWGGAEKVAARGAIKWEPSEQINSTLSVHVLRDRSEIWQRKLRGADITGFSDASSDPHDVVTNLEPDVFIDHVGAYLNNVFQFNNVQFTALTGIELINRNYVQDDGSPFRAIEQFFNDKAYSLSQEFLISSESNKLKWQSGLLFTHDSVEHFKTTVSHDVGRTEIDLDYHRRSTGIGVYGQTDYAITPELSLITGLRISHEHRTFKSRTIDTDPFNLSLNIFPELPLSTDDQLNNTGVSWRIGIDWQFNNDALLYVNTSRGFKSGGWDGSPVITASALLPFAEEKVMTHELGFKSTWSDYGLRLNGAIFYTDYENIQAESTQFVTTGLGTIPDNRIINAGDARIIGMELQSTWLTPIQGLTFESDIALTHSEVTEFTPGEDGNDFTNNELPDTPKISLNAKATYNWDIHHYLASASIDYQFRHKTFRDLNNSSELVTGSYGLLNARFDITSSDNNWSVGAYIHNITDKEYTTSNYFGGFGGVTQLYGLPRTYGVNFSINFY
ncbi:MAG: TonB-dependent receptor [Gammaproteobacteria bacterium]|jgi:iron complex outermembrane receptor protein